MADNDRMEQVALSLDALAMLLWEEAEAEDAAAAQSQPNQEQPPPQQPEQ